MTKVFIHRTAMSIQLPRVMAIDLEFRPADLANVMQRYKLAMTVLTDPSADRAGNRKPVGDLIAAATGLLYASGCNGIPVLSFPHGGHARGRTRARARARSRSRSRSRSRVGGRPGPGAPVGAPPP
jgi:hypothetical protein